MNKVYFDDKCIVCYSGITYLKEKHPKNDIEFIEISKLENPSSTYSKAIIGEFKTKKFKGLDTIIILLRELGYKNFSILMSTPIFKQVLSLLYNVFAYLIRPLLPKREV
jgi:predicted DCC family thiol-disulfide oxidoreductase YuxK